MIHNEYTQENLQDRQKITFHGSAYPKEILQQCTTATHTEAVHHAPLGIFHPCLWAITASGYLGGGHQASRLPSDASTPSANNSTVCKLYK